MILSDICKFIVDCPHSTAEDEGAGIPLIRTPNIGKGRFVLEGVHRVCESVYNQRCARAIPQDDDIIFAREAPAGNAAIIKNGQKVCLGQRTVLIRPDAAKVIPDYLVYYLLAPEQQYKLLGTANGATVAHVNLPTIREMKVDNLPPLPVQQRIADILSAYDDLIENNRKQIKLLEEAAQRLYKEWFIDLRFPGHEHTPIINGIPDGWKKKRLSNICRLRKHLLTPERIPPQTPYMGLEHMPRCDICLSKWGISNDANSNKFEYCTDDIIFGKIRPYFHKVGFALNNGVASTDAFIVIAENGLWGLLLMTMSCARFVDFSYQNCKEGAKMPRADWRQMEKYPVLIPSKETKIAFEKTICAIASKIKTLAFEQKSLQDARNRCLSKLMNDEIAPFIKKSR